MIRAIPEKDGGGKISRCPLVPYFSLFLLTTYVYIIIVNDATCMYMYLQSTRRLKKSLVFPTLTLRYDFFCLIIFDFLLNSIVGFGGGVLIFQPIVRGETV